MKVGIVGFGNIGKVLSFSLIHSEFGIKEMVIYDQDPSTSGAILDLQHASYAYREIKISNEGKKNLEACDFILHCAGVGVKKGGNRLETVKVNQEVSREIFADLTLQKDCKIIVVTNPVDIISYFTWKYSKLPANQVVGTGTLLDTYRLKYELDQENISFQNAKIIGEHGESMFIAQGNELIEDDDLQKDILKRVRTSARRIKETQEATIFGVCQAALEIFKALQNEEEQVLPISIQCPSDINPSGVYCGLMSKISHKGAFCDCSQINSADLKRLKNSISVLETAIVSAS